MKIQTHPAQIIRRLAVMGGAYGNVPALEACIRHARSSGCDPMAFIGDATGCCGHSDEVLELIRRNFSIRVAGNHEQQAAAGSAECGCNYASAQDERYGCLAHQYAMNSLSAGNQRWLGVWPDLALIETAAGKVLLCHGSPDRTNEFLYESDLDDKRLNAWLDQFQAIGFVCTHSGLPWIHRLADHRFAVNCGVVGKPDHDGDPAVHYALLEMSQSVVASITIERVEYDYRRWANELAREGVDEVFVSPLRTGVWTCGVSSLPPGERESRPRPTGGTRPFSAKPGSKFMS
jgi:diadenosine tetraphosphatase ApaH/serine/threonine PP2A family protein phosphatase